MALPDSTVASLHEESLLSFPEFDFHRFLFDDHSFEISADLDRDLAEFESEMSRWMNCPEADFFDRPPIRRISAPRIPRVPRFSHGRFLSGMDALLPSASRLGKRKERVNIEQEYDDLLKEIKEVKKAKLTEGAETRTSPSSSAAVLPSGEAVAPVCTSQSQTTIEIVYGADGKKTYAKCEKKKEENGEVTYHEKEEHHFKE